MLINPCLAPNKELRSTKTAQFVGNEPFPLPQKLSKIKQEPKLPVYLLLLGLLKYNSSQYWYDCFNN